MSFEDISGDISALVPDLRGRLRSNEPLAPITWFRVGCPAQLFFSPADEEDLRYFLTHIPAELPVTTIGLGSNLIVRDGGVPGVIIRLGRGFNKIENVDEGQMRIGAIVPDTRLAMAAADEVVDHARPDGAGTIESVEGDEIFEALRLELPQDVAHTAGCLDQFHQISDVSHEPQGDLLVRPRATVALALQFGILPPDL